MRLEIDLIEAARGATKRSRSPARSPAPTARARAPARGPSPRPATIAAARVRSSSPGASSRSPPPARPAGAKASRITDPCPTCRGDGRTPVRRQVKIDVPPGVETRDRSPAPEPGRGRRPGRPGATSGSRSRSASTRSSRGPATTCSAGSRSASPRRRSGPTSRFPRSTGRPTDRPQGHPERRGPEAQGPGYARRQRPGARRRAGRGVVETPHLSPRQEELLRELAEFDHRDVSPKRRGFLEKLRDFFTEPDETPSRPEP